MRSLKGKLLLDGGKLVDTAFHHAVVLICEHDSKGAFGLVLNRPSSHKVGEAADELVPGTVRHLPVYLGGPVQPQLFNCLYHQPQSGQPSDSMIMRGLCLARSLEELMEANGDSLQPAQVKFFAGYAGWSPGQLDREMKEKAWLTHPASIAAVFDPQPQTLWNRILRAKGPKYRLLAEMPDDVSRN